MKQSLILVIFLLMQTVTLTRAQTTGPLYALNQPAKLTTPEASPFRTKAQESSFYVKIYGFYSLLTPGVRADYSQSQTQISTPATFKLTNKNLGTGPRAGVGLGFIVSDFINLGVDADLLFGTTLKLDNSFIGSTYTYTNSTSTMLKVLSITPNITFKALSRPAYYIYNRLGLVGGIVLDYETVDDALETPTKGAATTYHSTAKYTKNDLAIGYQAALGIQFRLSQSLRGFAEVVAYNQSFKPRELQAVSISTKSGVATTQASTTVYKDQGDLNKTDPYEQPSFNVAINSVGVGAGLVLRF